MFVLLSICGFFKSFKMAVKWLKRGSKAAKKFVTNKTVCRQQAAKSLYRHPQKSVQTMAKSVQTMGIKRALLCTNIVIVCTYKLINNGR